MAITKTNLASFINHNIQELSKGGCADYHRRYGSMTLAEINACENAIAGLVYGKHTEVIHEPDYWKEEQGERA